MAEQAVSPMMQQYFEIKKQHPNEIDRKSTRLNSSHSK